MVPHSLINKKLTTFCRPLLNHVVIIQICHRGYLDLEFLDFLLSAFNLFITHRHGRWHYDTLLAPAYQDGWPLQEKQYSLETINFQPHHQWACLGGSGFNPQKWVCSCYKCLKVHKNTPKINGNHPRPKSKRPCHHHHLTIDRSNLTHNTIVIQNVRYRRSLLLGKCTSADYR